MDTSASRPSGADDKIRLAPKGRRKPTRFNSKTNNVQAKDSPSIREEAENVQIETKAMPNTNEEVKDLSARENGKDMVLSSEETSLKGSTSSTQESEKVSAMLDDAVIIHTPEERKVIQEKERLTMAVENEFGSWENLSVARSDSSLEKKEISIQMLTDTSKIEKTESNLNGTADIGRKSEENDENAKECLNDSNVNVEITKLVNDRSELEPDKSNKQDNALKTNEAVNEFKDQSRRTEDITTSAEEEKDVDALLIPKSTEYSNNCKDTATKQPANQAKSTGHSITEKEEKNIYRV